MSICGVSDKLVWWPAKNGFFLVKSAYYLEMQERDSTQGEPSNQTNDKVFLEGNLGSSHQRGGQKFPLEGMPQFSPFKT